MALADAFRLLGDGPLISGVSSGRPIQLLVSTGDRPRRLSVHARLTTWRVRLTRVAIEIPAVIAVVAFLWLVGLKNEAATGRFVLPVLLVVAATVALAGARLYSPELPFNRKAWAQVADHQWQVFATGVPLVSKRYVVMTEDRIAVLSTTGRQYYQSPYTAIAHVTIDGSAGLLFIELTGLQQDTIIMRLGPKIVVSERGLAHRSRNEPTRSTLLNSGLFAEQSHSGPRPQPFG